MLATTILVVCAVVALIALVLAKPTVTTRHGHTISLYWTAPFAGAVLLVALGLLPLSELTNGLTAAGDVNPLKILALFLSMTIMSIYLDEVGLFRFVAAKVLCHAGKDQRRLFFLLYATVSLLTVFTSNDIIVLTFTPFLVYFCRHANIDPIPYLVCEFVAANTASMCFVIGNPTNIYLATAAGIGFLPYAAVMLLPTLLSSVAACGMLYLLFHRSLATPITPSHTEATLADRGLLLIGLLHLGICTVLLVISSYLAIPMWMICLAFAASLFVSVTTYRLVRGTKTTHTFLVASLRRLPWDLVPFVLSMFALVLALSHHGLTATLADLLARIGDGTGGVFVYGVASLFTANLVNNIPMSVLFSELLSTANAGVGAIYATIIGSNIGAYLTPIGALAGIMWSGMLRHEGTALPFLRFVRYGASVALPSLFAALLGLLLVL